MIEGDLQAVLRRVAANIREDALRLAPLRTNVSRMVRAHQEPDGMWVVPMSPNPYDRTERGS